VAALAIVGIGAWWRSEDADFTRRLFRPMPIRASLDTSASFPRLSISIADSTWSHRNDIGWIRARSLAVPAGLIEDHGKLVHLFVISADGHSAFTHLHPTTADTVTFTSPLPGLPAGTYNVFADVVHTSGLTQTMTSTVSLRGGDSVPNVLADRDDSWALGHSPPADGNASRSVLEDGSVLTWHRNPAPLTAGEEAGLQFSVTPPAGDTASLEPFLGMAGHAVVVRDVAKVFIHLHPLGTISVAAQARLSPPSASTSHTMHMVAGVTDSLYFPYAFPQAGTFTVWVQVKRHGRVLTGSFPAVVRPGATRQ
jgi:hypothetical protein